MRPLCWSFKEDAPGVCGARTGSTYADVNRFGVDVAAAEVNPDVGRAGATWAGAKEAPGPGVSGVDADAVTAVTRPASRGD